MPTGGTEPAGWASCSDPRTIQPSGLSPAGSVVGMGSPPAWEPPALTPTPHPLTFLRVDERVKWPGLGPDSSVVGTPERALQIPGRAWQGGGQRAQGQECWDRSEEAGSCGTARREAERKGEVSEGGR